jgi:hypothetical protein
MFTVLVQPFPELKTRPWFCPVNCIDIKEYTDCLTARTTCLVCFISTVNGHCNKKRKEKKKLTLGRPALVAGTQQTLSNLF